MDLQEKCYLAKLIKRSVTYAVKFFVYQCLVHGKGHFTKRLKKAVQDHERKPLIL